MEFATDEFDTQILRFIQDEDVLHSYILQIAKRGRWFVVGNNIPPIAEADVSVIRPTLSVYLQENDKYSLLWLRNLPRNVTAQYNLDESSSNASGLYPESNLAKYVSALGREYGSSVEKILSGRVQINLYTTDGQERTLLHYAAEQGNADAVRMLLAMARKDGAGTRLNLDTNIQDKKGRTALILAVIGIKTKVIASKQSKFCTNSQFAVRVSKSRLSVIEVLLAAGAKVNLVDKENNNALHHAAEQGYAIAVRMLLAIGMNRGSYALYINALGNRVRSPLRMAVEQGHEDVVRALIATGVCSGVMQPVTDKARYEWSDKEPITDKACFQWSVLHINATEPDGRTALMYAAE